MPIPNHTHNPERTTASVRGLLIVARDRPDLYDALKRACGDSERVVVFLDRRREERRRELRPVAADARRMDRRAFSRREDDLRRRQYVLFRPHDRRPRD